MATNIGSLATTFIARTKPFESGVHRANRSMKGMRNQTMAVSASLKSMARTAIATIGAYVGFHAIKSMFVDFTRELDTLAKSAEKLGTTVQGLRQLQFISGLAGVDPEAIVKSMEKMLDSIGQAQQGLRSYLDVFEQLKLDVDELAQMDPSQAFKEILVAVADLPTAAEKMMALRRIFGRAGGDLMVIANMTAAEINALGIEFDELAGTVTADSLAAVEQYNDSLLRLSTAFASLKIQLTIFVSVALKPIIKWMTELTKSQVKGRSELGKTIAKWASMIATYMLVIALVPRIVKGIGLIIKAIKAMTKAQISMKAAAGNIAAVVAALGAAYFVGQQVEEVFEEIANEIAALEAEAAANIKVNVDDADLDDLETRINALNMSVEAVMKGTAAEVSARTQERQGKVMVKLLQAIAGNTADAVNAIAGLEIPAAPVAGIA
tara:strand:- start:1719 stop:3029 length:1311 start_codon:yes stop_codon:yes gene_type:complete